MTPPPLPPTSASLQSPSNGTTTQLQYRPFSDPNHLAPEDAFYANSPPRRLKGEGALTNEDLVATRFGLSTRRRREKERSRSKSQRRKGVWKKLLWVTQPYPDNYTDPPSFLSHLQRNPRLQPYDFWPLVADSTVIVQHVCSVAIFVCCFVGIFQERVSPVSVVGWGSAWTVLGWVFWDFWAGQEQAARSFYENIYSHINGNIVGAGEDATSLGSTFGTGGEPRGLGLSLPTSPLSTRIHSRNMSTTSLYNTSPAATPLVSSYQNGSATPLTSHSYYPPYNASASPFSARNQQRLATVKSAVLIYCALLGLSPILKSLTKSTTSDSIWAMSCWLMCINVFFFDYGGGPGVQFPASLSTNAALMASTVLASRLPSTTHVFSLTLFSIEVFGLFPVFRRHLRHRSWTLHVALTILLIVSAGAGLGDVLLGPGVGNEGNGWGIIGRVVVGVVVWGLGTVLAMGGCSWWLIGLQKYKNVVIGPWDPARPIIRGGGWD